MPDFNCPTIGKPPTIVAFHLRRKGPVVEKHLVPAGTKLAVDNFSGLQNFDVFGLERDHERVEIPALNGFGILRPLHRRAFHAMSSTSIP